MDRSPDTQNEPSDNLTRPITRHPWNSTHILKQWYNSNSSWPYPTAEEKERLSRRAGLSVRQVSQWFVNARRRSGDGRPREKSDSSENLIALSLPVTFDLPQEQCNNSKSSNHSSTVGESALLGAFSLAATESTPAESSSQNDVSANSQPSTNNPPNPIPSAASGYSSSRSQDLDFAHNHHSQEQHPGPQQNVGDRLAEDKSARLYQCTFCTDTFKSRYDWTRHEATLHLALKQWTCLPSGPKRWDFGDTSPKCSLCDECDPSDAHLQSHRISDCIVKPPSLKMFHRKDHLHQHLRLAHGIGKMIPSMNSWSSKIPEVKSRCGFCGETFALWADRNDHLADHFRRGKSMKDWKGDRGLEPSVAMLVQSAMPPYLIGAESLDLEPFSASKGVMKKILTSPGVQNPPNVFEVLTAQLGDFVTAARANGATINCDILRHKARLILYGDDDPLNQTPADNDQWLTLFKIGHGLASAAAPTTDEVSTAIPKPKIATSLLPDTGNPTAPHQLPGQKRPNTGPGRIHDDVESELPWWCQTPECLAELTQMSQEFALTSLGDIETDNESGKEY